MKRTYEEINEKIRKGDAVVLTAEEVIDLVESEGLEKATAEVDVVTTGTFGAMCSSGAFMNFGHSDPPIKMSKVWLNDVPAYAGIAAVDCYIGATEMMDGDGEDYGGAHVIEDLIAGKAVKLRAISDGTDCYPRKEIETYISLETLNEAYMYNPRNAYQNYAVGVNSSSKTLYTYMGKLLPKFGNATYSSAGQLSPLINDPHCRTIGIGTRIFLGGGEGYVAWQGTQFNTSNPERNGVPVGSSRTLAVIGDLRGMSADFIRALSIYRYGISLAVGIGIPIPILDENVMRSCAIKDEEIFAPVVDYSIQSRRRKALAEVSYAELRSGRIELFDKTIRTSSLSSYRKARIIAEELKRWIEEGNFEISKPVAPLPSETKVKPLNISTREELE
ncbi:MAG: L-aspartate semialdehyde sulfurtransferase [Candidatus Methanomethylophilaceae archaeon]|nr:L-aspartate semialdehyde sulfurtransferase [Candidatus Methanomethylophilaceae archaeon]MDI3542104.1 L-aspartate semialdehyde sulfurtransferase [Candidatus Methanomethylophilaceae archaeon]